MVNKKAIPRETHCKECGKMIYLQFYNAKEYVYKLKRPTGTLYFCNWNCMQKYKRANGLLPEQRGIEL